MEDNANHLHDYFAFFEALTPSGLDRLPSHLDSEARFKDPFNDVHGIDEIRRVFKHMFKVCDNPQFLVSEWALRENVAFVQWRFTYSRKHHDKRSDAIEGVSRIQFNADGMVTEHLDFWDPAEHIYQKLPVIGGLFRWLRSTFST